MELAYHHWALLRWRGFGHHILGHGAVGGAKPCNPVATVQYAVSRLHLCSLLLLWYGVFHWYILPTHLFPGTVSLSGISIRDHVLIR